MHYRVSRLAIAMRRTVKDERMSGRKEDMKHSERCCTIFRREDYAMAV